MALLWPLAALLCITVATATLGEPSPLDGPEPTRFRGATVTSEQEEPVAGESEEAIGIETTIQPVKGPLLKMPPAFMRPPKASATPGWVPVMGAHSSVKLNNILDQVPLNEQVLSRSRSDSVTAKSDKRANLKNCFSTDNLCFVGKACIYGPRLSPDESQNRKHSAIEEFSRKDNFFAAERKRIIETCNVGAIVTLKSSTSHARNYSFEYHTTVTNNHLALELENVEILIGYLGEISCKPNCLITLQDAMQQFGAELFYKGEIFFETIKPSEDPRKVAAPPEKSRSGGPSDADSLPLAIEATDDPVSKKGKLTKNVEKKEKESTLGIILIICGSALLVFIIAAIIVITLIQRRHAKKENRRQATIEAASHTITEKSMSLEIHRKEQKKPLIQKTKTPMSQSAGPKPLNE